MAIDYQCVAGEATKGHKDTKDIFIYRGGFLWKDFLTGEQKGERGNKMALKRLAWTNIFDRRTGGTGGRGIKKLKIKNKKWR